MHKIQNPERITGLIECKEECLFYKTEYSGIT